MSPLPLNLPWLSWPTPKDRRSRTPNAIVDYPGIRRGRRRSTANAVSLLDISFLPALVTPAVAPSLMARKRDCPKYWYCEYQYWLLQIPVLRVINSKTPLRHYCGPLSAAERTRPTNRRIRTAVVKWRQLAQKGGRQIGQGGKWLAALSAVSWNSVPSIAAW